MGILALVLYVLGAIQTANVMFVHSKKGFNTFHVLLASVLWPLMITIGLVVVGFDRLSK